MSCVQAVRGAKQAAADLDDELDREVEEREQQQQMLEVHEAKLEDMVKRYKSKDALAAEHKRLTGLQGEAFEEYSAANSEADAAVRL